MTTEIRQESKLENKFSGHELGRRDGLFVLSKPRKYILKDSRYIFKLKGKKIKREKKDWDSIH